MKGLAFAFVLSAAVYLTIGMLWGITMGIQEDFTMAPAHAHLNLVGGVLMALFGLYYHAVPAAAATGLAKLHFGLATLGAWVFPTGIAIAQRGPHGVAIIGSFLVLAAMLVFLIMVLRNRA
jgi:hypothetical protein